VLCSWHKTKSHICLLRQSLWNGWIWKVLATKKKKNPEAMLGSLFRLVWQFSARHRRFCQKALLWLYIICPQIADFRLKSLFLAKMAFIFITLVPIRLQYYYQFCQMVYFYTKNQYFGYILESLVMVNVSIFYGHMEYFKVIWYMYFDGHFVVIWYLSPRFGMFYQWKSGNPGCNVEGLSSFFQSLKKVSRTGCHLHFASLAGWPDSVIFRHLGKMSQIYINK
jgi:hypothetical protein